MFVLYSVLFYCIKQIWAVSVSTFVGSELVPYCCRVESEVRFVLVFKYFERKPNRFRCIFFLNFHIIELVFWRGGGVLSDFFLSKWPRREKTCFRGFAINTGADQPAHTRILISAFVIRF